MWFLEIKTLKKEGKALNNLRNLSVMLVTIAPQKLERKAEITALNQSRPIPVMKPAVGKGHNHN